MNKLNVARNSLRVIIVLGVTGIVSNIVKSTSPAPENIIEKITQTVSKYALGGMAAAETVKYADKKFDEITGKLANTSEPPVPVTTQP